MPTTCGTAASFVSRARTSVRTAAAVAGPVGAHHDVDGVTRLGRELVLEQRLRSAGVRPGCGVVGLELAAEGAGQHDREAESGHPGQHGQQPVAVGQVGQPAERARSARRRPTGGRGGSSCWSWGASSASAGNVMPHNKHEVASLVKPHYLCNAALRDRDTGTQSASGLTRREKARLATTDEIKATALDLMREQGTTDVRFTDIARVMGMTAPALYRYFDDRDELLTALIADGYRALGARIAAALAPLPAEDLAGRWVAAASAYREWARSEPQQFALVLGMPVPGYVAPDEGPTTEAAKAAMGAAGQHLRRGGGVRAPRRAADPRGLPGRHRLREGQARRADRHRAAGELPGHDADLGDAARLRQPGGLRPLRLAGARRPRRAVPQPHPAGRQGRRAARPGP